MQKKSLLANFCLKSLPKRFLPPTFREAHGGGIDGRIFLQQRLEVGHKSAMRINGIDQIGDAAKLRINLVGRE